jgi:polysaccharide export outer membrane protein
MNNTKYKTKIFLLLFSLFPLILAYAGGNESEANKSLQRKALLDAVQKKQDISSVERLAVKEVPVSKTPQPVIEEKPTVTNKSESLDDNELLANTSPTVEYYIVPGDTMDIIVLEEPDVMEETTTKSQKSAQIKDKKPSGAYTINIGDTLEVLVWQTPDLSKNVIVGPDGKVSYPLVGRLQVAGLTIEEVEKKFTEELSKYVKAPQISIMINQFAKDKVEQIGGKISSALDKIGVSRSSITVGPDGKISYPLIGRFQASGMSISQLESEITKRFSLYVKSPKVSIMMTKFIGDKVVILGEVKAPGIYTFSGQINLFECLAMSGDFTEKARKDSVIVIRGSLTKHPEVVRIDMLKIMTKGPNKTGIMLQPNDVVYVPKSFIANFNKFVENMQPLINAASGIISTRQTALNRYNNVSN